MDGIVREARTALRWLHQVIAPLWGTAQGDNLLDRRRGHQSRRPASRRDARRPTNHGGTLAKALEELKPSLALRCQ